jgi:hypothetical protein
MIWIFASVVLLLLVNNRGFRRFVIWTGATAAAVLAVAVAVATYQHERSTAEVPLIDPAKVQWDPVPAVR